MTNLAYEYDGTWPGMLTAIFESFDRKENPSVFYTPESGLMQLFEKNYIVQTDFERANRVKVGLVKKSKKTYRRIYRAFLSAKKDRELVCLELSKLVFKNVNVAENDYGNPFVLRAKQIEKEMSKEVHRMHAFVRFQHGVDEIWYAFVKPDFDVMPLIGDHFKRRYADQKWMIYDLNRNYGLYYDLNKMDYVNINFDDKVIDGKLPMEALSENELNYQGMWQKYFESINIKERKNMRLHLQHVPKRYWHLMTEKL